MLTHACVAPLGWFNGTPYLMNLVPHLRPFCCLPQCVVQALKLLHGDNAVLPALRAAAESYHAHKAATVNDLAQLLAQVSLAADQVCLQMGNPSQDSVEYRN
jgi:hypothetical protein